MKLAAECDKCYKGRELTHEESMSLTIDCACGGHLLVTHMYEQSKSDKELEHILQTGTMTEVKDA